MRSCIMSQGILNVSNITFITLSACTYIKRGQVRMFPKNEAVSENVITRQPFRDEKLSAMSIIDI